MTVVSLFGLDGGEVVAVLEWAAVVEPVDPFGGRDLEVLEALPGPAGLSLTRFSGHLTCGETARHERSLDACPLPA